MRGTKLVVLKRRHGGGVAHKADMSRHPDRVVPRVRDSWERALVSVEVVVSVT